MKTKEQTHGHITFTNGFNLKDEVIKRLNTMGVQYGKVRHSIVSPYEYKRYKPEFVGQEVWVKDKFNNSVCFTQTDYESILSREDNTALDEFLYGCLN